MRKNSYEGRCDVCSATVLAGEGALIGPPWKTRCIPCSGQVPDAPVAIKVFRLVDGSAGYSPSAHLGSELFAKYRMTLSTNGGFWDGTQNRSTFDKALACIKALEDAGFLLQINPEVSATLSALSAQRKEAVVQTSVRVSRIDEGMKARGLALFPFQKIGAAWLVEMMAALLADDMGLGKTIQALAAIPEGSPVLVIGPDGASGVWRDETAKWRPDLKFSKVKTRVEFRMPMAGEMVFASYGMLPAEVPSIPANMVLIADEAQRLAHAKTQQTRRFRGISEKTRQVLGRVWLLTATPLMNRPPELWSVLQAAGLAKTVFGAPNIGTYDNFKRLFDAVENQWGGVVWGDPDPRVPELLRKVSLRRLKKDVLKDLPEKTYRVIPVAIGAEWTKALAKWEKTLTIHQPTIYDWLRAGPNVYDWDAPKPGASGPDPVVTANQIEAARQALLNGSGASFRQLSEMRTMLAKAKIPAMLDIVEEFEEQDTPLLVFSEHRAPIDTLGQRPGWATITGDTDGDLRQTIAKDFQDGKYKGLALTIDAGGTALTLTRATNVLFVDRKFTPKLNEQAEDRACRIGQTRGVVIHDLVADHYLDRRLAAILGIKSRLVNASVEASSVTGEAIPVVASMVEVDFDKLADEARIEMEKNLAARCEAERIAAERAEKAELLRAQAELEAERERAQMKYDLARDRAKERGWIEGDDVPRHPATTEAELWAAESLLRLAAMDPDRAQERNDIGFNKADSYAGHWLCQEIGKGLTDNQWRIVIELCRPYHRQVGRCPE